jgi:hypothetical protein
MMTDWTNSRSKHQPTRRRQAASNKKKKKENEQGSDKQGYRG